MSEDGDRDRLRPRCRVLHVITRLDRGGSAENTLLTMAHLDPDQYEVTLAVGPSQGRMSPTLDLARDRGVRIVHIPHLIRAVHPWYDLRALGLLWRLSRGFDLVHTHTSKAGIVGRLAARLARAPHVIHTPHAHVFYGYYSAVVTRMFLVLERIAARWCDRIVALTEADLEDHVRFNVAPGAQFIVIHSGVDLRALGRLTAIKGQSDLIRAVAQFDRPVWLLFVGDGEEQEALHELAEDVGISERTVFAGWRSDTGDLLRTMDLFAFPSLNEGLGKALVEAMYLRRPIVATRVGAVPQLMEDKVHGLLVPARPPSALTQALQMLCDEPKLALGLAEAAHERSKAFGVDSMIEMIETMYQDLLSRSTPELALS